MRPTARPVRPRTPGVNGIWMNFSKWHLDRARSVLCGYNSFRSQNSMSPWRILVAGDDPEAREPVAAALLADGYAVDVASSARDALELARQRDYAVSLVDFAVGKACEVLAQIRLLRPQCFLIALTAGGSFDASLPAGKMDA